MAILTHGYFVFYHSLRTAAHTNPRFEQANGDLCCMSKLSKSCLSLSRGRRGRGAKGACLGAGGATVEKSRLLILSLVVSVGIAGACRRQYRQQ